MEIEIKKLAAYPFKKLKNIDLYNLEYICEDLGVSFYELNNHRFNPEIFDIREIYDNPHDSDESSYRYIMFFRGVFTCIYGYTGDRGSSYIGYANKEVADELRNYLFTLKNDDGLPSINLLKDVVNLSDRYTQLVEFEDGFYYHINSPRWSYCFETNVNNLYYIENDKVIKTEFVRWKHPKLNSWEKEGNHMIIKVDGKETETDGSNLVFKCD